MTSVVSAPWKCIGHASAEPRVSVTAGGADDSARYRAGVGGHPLDARSLNF
jgi:hypothetical protein